MFTIEHSLILIFTFYLRLLTESCINAAGLRYVNFQKLILDQNIQMILSKTIKAKA